MNQDSYLKNVVDVYIFYKKMLAMVNDADDYSPEAYKFRTHYSLEQIQDITQLVKEMEDNGIHLLVPKYTN